MKSTNYKLLLVLICFCPILTAQAQQKGKTATVVTTDTISLRDNRQTGLADTLTPDSLKTAQDSTVYSNKIGVKISKDAIKENITYGAQDSNWTDVVNSVIHLYGKADIVYEATTINGDSIIVDFDNNMANSYVDKSKYDNPEDYPKFNNEGTEASYEKVAFNFETKKAILKDIRTQDGEFYLLGAKSKYVSKENDTLYHEDKFYNVNSLITTCNHPNPHFGIRTMKMKMVPNKIAVVGPSMIEIMGVPTPLVLPFGFFPLIKGQSSGLIFPSSYDYNADLGFGLREIGYYFPINDYIDMRVTGDIYTRGTHAIRLNTNYTKRYQYRGGVDIGYNNNRREFEGTPQSQKSFSLNLRHDQDSKAHPYRTIGGNINISTNLYNQRTFNNAQSVLDNTTRSSFNFNYRWPESPFKFSMGLDHNQNTVSRQVNITLPTANLTMNSITPFKRKNASGDPLWYENIVLGYNSSFRNYVQATDTTLFSSETLKNLQTGFAQNASLSTNFRVMKYFNVSPSVNYNDVYFLRTLKKELTNTLVIDSTLLGENSLGEGVFRRDTTFGVVRDNYITQFKPYNNFNASVSINTQMFLTKQFSKGKIRGLRHVMKPSISLNYSPNTIDRYTEYVDNDLRPEFNIRTAYNPFTGGIYSTSLNQETFGVSWNINHILEGKYWSKKDTIAKKFKFFENMYWSGSYNFAADSMKWSDVAISGTTSILGGLSTFNFSSVLTPYKLSATNTRLNKYISEDRRFPLQHVSTQGNFNTGLTFTQIRNIISGKGKASTSGGGGEQRSQGGKNGNRVLLDLFDNFRLSHNLTVEYGKVSNRDTFRVVVNSIQFFGSIPLTENWDMSVGNFSYDLQSKQFIYPDFSFSRDLHCWNMRFSWQPSRDVYSFYIGVKSSAFSFLKYDYGQQNANSMFRPF